jgi:hypothetical protein
VFGWAVVFEKAAVGCGKSAVKRLLWEKQKTVWLEQLWAGWGRWSGWGREVDRTNCSFFHNQWQVGKFLP